MRYSRMGITGGDLVLLTGGQAALRSQKIPTEGRRPDLLVLLLWYLLVFFVGF